MPGYDVKLLDAASGQELPSGSAGLIAVKLPLPPGCFPTLWQDDKRFIASHMDSYPGYYLTGDHGHIDEDGYVWILGRTDDIINVAGHRLSTGDMEEVLATHPDVAECAVIGVADNLKGQVPVGLCVLKAGVATEEQEIVAEVIKMVREQVGPIASFRKAMIVKGLPKTRSGKVLRSTMRKIADGEEYSVPPTIEDPAVLEEISEALGAMGLGKKSDS
jgi:propionyl-CoA synthetase